MDPYYLNTDIKVLCVEASSFPQGITAAFEKLNSLIQSLEPRRIFGISYGNSNGNIIYKAAAEEKLKDEAVRLGCERFIIQKGEYISIYIADFMNEIPRIGQAFQRLLTDPRIDRNGCCIEMYLNNNKDVICLVRLEPGKL